MNETPSWHGRTSAGEVVLDLTPPVARARLSGKLDNELVKELVSGAGRQRHDALVIDLSKVSYVSSSGFAGLANLSAHGDVRLAAPTQAFRDVAGVLGLDVLLRMFDDVGEAARARPRTSSERPGASREETLLSVATCGNCGAAWNVAGIVGIASIQCQRCGAQIPLGAAPPPVDAGWATGGGMLSGEGILAMPAAPGTPVGENAVPCGHCGTVLDATGLVVGMLLRCGRCAGVFPRPHASQIAAIYGGGAPPPQQQVYAPPNAPAAAPAAAPPKTNESTGDLELSLKNSTRCNGCGRDYYDEEMPEPDDQGKIRCKRCKKVMKDLNEEEEDEDEDEGSKGKRGLGKRGLGSKSGPKKAAPPKKPPPPEKVILDEKFKSEVFGALKAGDETGALRRCMEFVKGREVQGKQIYDHLHGIAKKKNWIGIAKPAPGARGAAPARPGSGTKPGFTPNQTLAQSTPSFAPNQTLAHSNPGFGPNAAYAPPPGAPPPPAYPAPPAYGAPAPYPGAPGFAPPPAYATPGYAPGRPAPSQGGYPAPQGFAPGGAPPGYAPQPGFGPPPGYSNAPAFTAPGNAPGLVAEPVTGQGAFAAGPGVFVPGVPEGLELLPDADRPAPSLMAATAVDQPSTSAPVAPPPPAGVAPGTAAHGAAKPPADAEPAEEGFLGRVARDGRVAQLEVLVTARRFAAARDLAKGILAREARVARALTLLSETLAGLGDDDGALDAASKGARLEPDDARAVRVYAQALARKGRFNEAANAMRRVVGPRKGEARDAVLLADILRRQGDEAGARRIMEEVVARDPQSLEPVRQAALQRAAARDLEGSASELEKLLEKEKPPRPISLAVATELSAALLQAGASAPAKALVSCAKALDACGKTIAAVRLLGPLVQRDPNATDARRALGLAYARLGAAPLAEEHLRAVAGRGGAGADELRALGELALERGDAEGAVRVLLRAKEARPDDAQVRRALARAFETTGDLQKAVEELEAACAARPTDRELEAAHASLSARALAARIASLEARVRENPEDAQGHLDLGTALFEKGDAPRAFDSLSRAARDPYLIPRAVEVIEFIQDELEDPRAAVILLKELHVKAHDVPRAIQVLEGYLKSRPEDPLRLDLLELYAQGQRVTAAVEGLLALLPKVEPARLTPVLALADKILEQESARTDLARQVALARRRSGDHEGAARAWEKLLEGEPGDREARIELARALEDAGKLEAAQAALERLTGDPEATAEELSYTAALLARLERHDQVVTVVKRALEKRPDDRSLKEKLERAEAAIRDVEAARLALDVKAGKASEDDRRKLAALYAEAGKKDETLELLKALPGSPPGEPDAVFLRFAAEQLARRGRIDKAEACLRQLCTVLAYPEGSEQEKTMLYRIAALYERAGDRRSSRRVYLELVARDPGYRDAYAKLEASEDSGPAPSEPEEQSERSFVEFVETEAPRDLKTIFESLATLDLGLDATLLAEARAAQSAVQAIGDDPG